MYIFPIKVCLLFIAIRFQKASSLLFKKSSLKTFFMSLLIIVTIPYPRIFISVRVTNYRWERFEYRTNIWRRSVVSTTVSTIWIIRAGLVMWTYWSHTVCTNILWLTDVGFVSKFLTVEETNNRLFICLTQELLIKGRIPSLRKSSELFLPVLILMIRVCFLFLYK